jgi:hypothetical protein
MDSARLFSTALTRFHMAEDPITSPKEVCQILARWVLEHVARTEVAFGVPICPYAREAWVNGKVRIAVHEGSDLASFARQAISVFPDRAEMLMVVERDLSSHSDAWAHTFCSQLNTEVRQRGLVVLYDHPYRPGRIGSVVTSNGHFLVFFVQELLRLNAASTALHQTVYYDAWTPEYYEEVVASRAERTLS